MQKGFSIIKNFRVLKAQKCREIFEYFNNRIGFKTNTQQRQNS